MNAAPESDMRQEENEPVGRIRVLHLEDDPDDVELVQRMFKTAGMDCQNTVVQTREAFETALRENCFDLVLADYTLPTYDGMSALRYVQGLKLDVPFVFVSGTMGEEAAIEGLTEGATDYVLKQKLSRLVPAVNRALNEAENRRERHRVEESLHKVNRALTAISTCNSTLIRSNDEQKLLDDICRLIVEICGYRLVWVGYAEQDEAKTLRPVARYGHDEGYVDALKITWSGDNEYGLGPAGRAARSGATQFVQDYVEDPSMAPWRAKALKRGYRSSIAVPLASGPETIGVLVLYSGEPNAFVPEEIALLEQLADDVAYGITGIRTRTERDRALQEMRRSMDQLRDTLEDTILAVAATIEYRDPYTAGHQRRVADLAMAIAADLGLPTEQIHGLRLGCVVHDIGKIQVPAEILSKPGALSSAEFEIVKQHPRAGYEILKGVDFPWPIAEAVYQHHERLDGSGYPRGLRGDDILLEAKIMAVADVMEAMSSHRPYRPGLGIDAALEELERGRGITYDEAAVDACIRIFKEKRFAFEG